MKALVFDRFGEPGDVLQLKDVPTPEPGPGQVRVRMLASPINPSDLLVVRGQYGRLPTLPATPGFEGVGIVEATGPGLLRFLRGLRTGKRVAVLNSVSGNWQEQVIVPVRQAVPVSDDLPEDQIAMFFVNPSTALIMTRAVLKVPYGAWLLQTAAYSAVGRMVIRLGKFYGFRTINIVRRAEQVEELKHQGADHVIVSDGDSFANQVRDLSGGGVKYALDAVGGSVGNACIDSLGRSGKMLVYGTLSNEPLKFDPRILMVGQKFVGGFWLSEWVKDQNVLGMLKLFRRVQGLIRNRVLVSEVAASYSLDDYQKAIAQAQTSGRTGKVLLKIGAGTNSAR